VAVIDDGPGMDKEQLLEVRRRIESEEEVYRHIGLTNTARRIRLIYHTEDGLAIRSKSGRGTVVSLNLPLREPEGSGS
jgi:sensor histidine kinase YesM